MKNIVYFMLEALFFLLDAYIFVLNFYYVQNQLNKKKVWLISKFMMSQQIIVISILPNISRRKSNQTMKVSQRIEYNKRNSFLERSYTKCGGEASPRAFQKKSKLSISPDQ